jgi:arabinogalactan endo-1,4-beta-galactosidase
MKAIDSLLPETKLKGADLEKVKSLRTEGQKLYDEGRENDAAKLLKEARKMLKDAAS